MNADYNSDQNFFRQFARLRSKLKKKTYTESYINAKNKVLGLAIYNFLSLSPASGCSSLQC